MANLKDFSFEKVRCGDKVLHKELGIGEVLGICKPSVQIFFPDMCGGAFMDLQYNNGWNLENTGIEFIGEFRREKTDVEDKQGMTWTQFFEKSGSFLLGECHDGDGREPQETRVWRGYLNEYGIRNDGSIRVRTVQSIQWA